MPETMSKKAAQRCIREFKGKAVGMLTLGKPLAEAAQDLEVSAFMLHEWWHKVRKVVAQDCGP